MARQPHPQPPSTWGTFEELLLACAVNRHGTDSWESIATEVQNRTSTFSSLTSQNCIEKFSDLKRRFGFGFSTTQNDTASLIDELRKLRVEELRREVQRCDVSIVSLEMKVKRLEDDGEKSLKTEPSDLERLQKPSPETIAGNSAVGEESGDDGDRSFNESNSTSQQPHKDAKTKMDTGQNDIKPELEMKEEADPVRVGSDPEPGRDRSHNGKFEDDDEKKPKLENNSGNNKKEVKTKRVSQAGGLGDSNELLGESVGESKREEKEIKQNNSDVQSSVSLTMKKKKRRRGGEDGSSSGEEERAGGDDEVSPATKMVSAVKSEPLVKILEIIRAHRLGSMFQRRLRTQESERYKNLIRQHIDLKMVQSRLNKGVYSNCNQKLFRDLLLLFNNAIVFFRKNSPENLAAIELRALVLKEMKEKVRKLGPRPLTVKPATEQQTTSFSKPNKSSSSLVACGRRGSIKAISENDSSKKGDRKDREVEEKPKTAERKIEGSLMKSEDRGIKKKRTKEGLVSGRRNSRTSDNNGERKHQYGGNELSSHDALELKVDRKEGTTRKRQGAASFLKRMKQNSPSEAKENNDDDSSEDESEDSKVEDKKRRGGRDGDGMTQRVTRSSRGRGSIEARRNIKRVGRPPKKQTELGGGSGKRGRDDDSDVGVGGAGRSKKRSRKV